MGYHNSLFVFDIETIPDTEVVSRLVDCDSDDLGILRETLTQYHLNITGGNNGFPRQLFHKVIAISFLEAEITQDPDGGGEYFLFKSLRSGGNLQSNELDLVRGFFTYLKDKRARLVSYNGRTFDLPVLKYRAMKHGISAPWLYKNGDKWNNYTQKYSLDWHCDLLDALSDFGSSARVKLDEICALLKLPGKIIATGGDVMEWYDQGEIKKIRDYCELDVLNTYLVYLHYTYHTGSISKNAFHKAIDDITNFLVSQPQEQSHFHEFKDAWLGEVV